jgi:hypothetical protein
MKEDNTYMTTNNIEKKALVAFSLDDTKGVVQHKSTIRKHMINHKFYADDFFVPFSTLHDVPKFTWVPDARTDVRVLNEIRVIYEYYQTYHESIVSIEATMDMIPGNFTHQVQTNQDYLIKLFTFGNVKFRHTYQDEKSGMDMFRHSTRGSIGLLTYDSATGANVQMTRDPITPEKLIEYNSKRLSGITEGLKNDGILNESFNLVLGQCHTRVKSFDNIDLKNPQDIFDMHNGIQQELFHKIQRHPAYNRSISFIFTKHVEYPSYLDPEFEAFAVRFKSLLGATMYDLDSSQDRKDIFKAMLIAYKTEVDPKVLEKLQYLQHGAGISFNVHFLQDIATLIKHGLL